jgi:hypothetical protein
MAATIETVRDLIEDNAAEHGWDDAEIQSRINSGLSANRIASIYWEKRAQQTLYLVNISEAGSSRSLESIHARMVAMAKKYRDLADAEIAEPTEGPTRFLHSHPITRV